MSQLGYYAGRVAGTKGLEHQAVLANLRNYIRTTPERELISEIMMIDSFEKLRALWEAGLPSSLQDAALRRYTELELKRR